jgi:hypothetical protein
MQNILTYSPYLKPDCMAELKLKQSQYECDTWKRLLAFMMEENIYRKNRIAEILKDKFNKELLPEVENFQNRFIKEDELINILRDDIARLDKLLLRQDLEDGKIVKEIKREQNRLRNNMLVAEKHFNKLQTEFNSYPSENI